MKKQAIILSTSNSLNNLLETIFSLSESFVEIYFFGNANIKISENRVDVTKARIKKEFK